MVTDSRTSAVGFVMTLTLLLATSTAFAAVTARVDRPAVDLNESFLLEIVIDTNIDAEPDLDPLDESFYVGGVSQLSNTQIINGQIRRSRTWSVTLLAKATGEQNIPSIQVGAERSQPISIRVNEPSNAPPGEADVFVSSEVDQSEAFVQSQIVYRIKVYRAVNTRQHQLREPTFGGVEALVELAGEERSYSARLNGKDYSVSERVLAIYPQESGEFTISPARFEARVLSGGRISGRKVFESDTHTVTVLPIPAPPAEFPNAVWLPAHDVSLSEEWSREPNEVMAGEPVTRHVTLSALGQIETQLPALLPPEVEGMNIYADKPELTRRVEAEGIRGVRKDQYAMIGVRGGDVAIPELAVPWWNISIGEWQVARLPARTLTIDAPAAAVVEAPASEPELPNDAADSSGSALMPDAFWKQSTQIMIGVWLVTLLAWWWSSKNAKPPVAKQPPPVPIYKQQAKFEKAARKAARSGDAHGVKQAMLAWGRLQWPEDVPRSIGALAERLELPLADELRKLSRASYGQDGVAWDGAALAAALRRIQLHQEAKPQTVAEALPPLMPPRKA